MSKFLVWVCARNRFTYWDIAAFIVASVIGGCWGLAFLAAALIAGALIGHAAELWHEDEERGKL